ncbi:MAG: hypothetical protein V1494_01995 [Candidatus Diapherotrites archaeon]
MAKKAYPEQVHDMVEFCIKKAKINHGFNQKESEKFEYLLNESKNGVNIGLLMKLIHKNRSPQSTLLAAEQLGLLRDAQHKQFMEKYRPLLYVESMLQALRPFLPPEFRKVFSSVEAKPVKERFKILSQMSKINFTNAMRQWEHFHDAYLTQEAAVINSKSRGIIEEMELRLTKTTAKLMHENMFGSAAQKKLSRHQFGVMPPRLIAAPRITRQRVNRK